MSYLPTNNQGGTMNSLSKLNIDKIVGSKICGVTQHDNSYTIVLENGLFLTVSSKLPISAQYMTAPLFLIKDKTLLQLH